MLFHSRKITKLLTAASAMAFLSASCMNDKYVKEEGMIWNTTYHITYNGTPDLKDSVITVLNEVGKSLNVFDGNSLVSQVNSSDSLKVDRHFRQVYIASRIVNDASGGMFDPTLSPLITAWGFGPGHKTNADTVAIDSILEFIGITKTHLHGETLVKDDKRIQFNFSAVAKGYGCDAIAEMLKRNGVEDYLVEIGGEIALGGKSPKGGSWKISVDKPIQTDSTEIHDAVMVIGVTDAGIATSGNYRNYRNDGGKTIGHTLSPLTGHPVTTDVISATVIAPNAMKADAVATACMASGSEAAKSILNSLKMEGMLILSDSTTWMTPGFDTLVIHRQD